MAEASSSSPAGDSAPTPTEFSSLAVDSGPPQTLKTSACSEVGAQFEAQRTSFVGQRMSCSDLGRELSAIGGQGPRLQDAADSIQRESSSGISAVTSETSDGDAKGAPPSEKPSGPVPSPRGRRSTFAALSSRVSSVSSPSRKQVRRLGRYLVSAAPGSLRGARVPVDERQRMQMCAESESLFQGIIWLRELLSADDEAKVRSQGGTVVELEDDSRKRVEVRRFPCCPRRDPLTGRPEQIYKYGCSVAIALYLRFLWEGAIVFFATFALSSAALNDNVKRNNFRAACREAASTTGGYAALVFGRGAVSAGVWNVTVASLGFEPADCGWLGKPIRYFNASETPHTQYQPIGWPSGLYMLRSALGGCQEYTYYSTNLLWQFGDPTDDFLVDTPDAIYCLRPHEATWGWSLLSQWMQLLSVVLLLVWLVRLRWLTQSMAAEADREVFSTSDYAVLMTGLDEKLPADALKAQLEDELATLCADDKGRFCSLGVRWVRMGCKWEERMPHTSPLRWAEVDMTHMQPQHGTRIVNLALEAALRSHPRGAPPRRFDADEWRALGMVEGQVTHDAYVQVTDGGEAAWRFFRPVTSAPATGVELELPALAAALRKRRVFSPHELTALDMREVAPHHFVTLPAEGGDVGRCRYFGPVAGAEIVNAALSEALRHRQAFTPEDLESFGLGVVRDDSYVRCADPDGGAPRFFVPAGFFREGIHHIEVGRHCEDELQVFRALRALDVSAGELDACRRAKEASGHEGRREKRALKKLAARLHAKQVRLKELWDAPDMATGHAFVVFHLEEDRNRLVRLLHDLMAPASLRGYLEKFYRERRRLANSRSPTLVAIVDGPSTLPTAAPRSSSTRPLTQPAPIRCVSATAKRPMRTHQFGLVQRLWLKLLKCWCRIRAAPGELGPLNIVAAPEPDEVQWDNFQYDERFVRKMEFRFEMTILLAVAVGAVALVAMKMYQVQLVQEQTQRLGQEAATTNSTGKAHEPTVSYAELARMYGFTALVSLTTMVWDLGLTYFAMEAVRYERHDVITEEHESVFSKLSWAYLLNALVVPLGLGMVLSGGNGLLIDQTWYEPGGIIQQALLLVIFNYITPLFKGVNLMVILNRHVLGRLVYSQRRLNELYEPAPYDIGISA